MSEYWKPVSLVRSFLTLGVCLSVWTPAFGAAPQSFEQCLDKAFRTSADHQYDQTIDWAGKAISFKPADSQAYLLRAWALHQKQHPVEALKDYESFLRLGGKMNPAYWQDMAVCCAETEQWQRGLKVLDQAIALEPAAYSYRLKGQIYRQLNDDRSAVEVLKKAVALAPNDYWGLRELASCYTSLHKYSEALNLSNRLIKLRPQEPDGYALRAKIYEKLGQPVLAKKDLERVNQKADFPF